MIGPFILSSFDSKNNCCGCCACKDICPVQAISFSVDNEGFNYPVIDDEKCTHCLLCEKVCPLLNHKSKHSMAGKVFSCHSKDNTIRNDGSSGGVFEQLAQNQIESGGLVVGAVFDSQFSLNHTIIREKSDIKSMCKSKYMQSNTDGIFSQVKKYLDEKKDLLFVGTPCQVSALNNYLGKKYESLLTVDFVCHGVPSNKMFIDYIRSEEKRKNIKINHFSFRVKDGHTKHVHGYSYTYLKKRKKKVHYGMYYENPFYLGFKKYLLLRPSCYSCLYCTPERTSDITLGDFWGIEQYQKQAQFEKGISMVLLNSEKGKKRYFDLFDKFISTSYDIDIALKCNDSLSKNTTLPSNRSLISDDYSSMSFDCFAKKHLKSPRKNLYAVYYALPLFVRHFLSKIYKRDKYL